MIVEFLFAHSLERNTLTISNKRRSGNGNITGNGNLTLHVLKVMDEMVKRQQTDRESDVPPGHGKPVFPHDQRR